MLRGWGCAAHMEKIPELSPKRRRGSKTATSVTRPVCLTDPAGIATGTTSIQHREEETRLHQQSLTLRHCVEYFHVLCRGFLEA